MAALEGAQGESEEMKPERQAGPVMKVLTGSGKEFGF